MAVLVGLRPLCATCHLVKHSGRAGIIGRAQEARAHAQRVNRWTVEQWEAADLAARTAWRRRSQQAWSVAVDPALAARWPALRAVETT